MRRIPTSWILLLLASPKVSGDFDDGDCVRETYPTFVFQVTGGYDPRNTNADSCKAACANLEDTTITSAGITNGNVCLCGRDTSGLLVVDAEDCDSQCSDTTIPVEAYQCGGRNGHFTVYNTGSLAPKNLEFNIEESNGDIRFKDISFGQGTEALEAHLFFKFGPDSMLAPFQETLPALNASTWGGEQGAWYWTISFISGKNVAIAQVAASDGSATVTAARTFETKVSPLPSYLNCPPVAEINVQYSCSFAAVGGDTENENLNVYKNNEFVTLLEFGGISSVTLGHPPAQRKSDIPADSSQEPNTPVVLRGTRASTMLSVYSVQWLGSDTIKIAAFQPVCTNQDAVYDAQSGKCETEPQDEATTLNHVFGLEHTCPQGSPFQSMLGTCAKESCQLTSQTCQQTPDESFTFEQQADQTGEFTTEINSGLDIELKYYLSDTPIIILQPGQYLGIVGEVFVGQTPFDSEKDFYVDKTLAKGKYLVEAQTYRPEFIDLPFTCDDDTKLETISFESEESGLTLTNITECQTPIDGYVVVFSTEITEQKENWAPEMWVATDELVSIAQTTSKGNPIYFRTDWGVVDGDDDVIETNITTAGVDHVFSDFSYRYDDPGKYTVKSTAYNLHSEYEYGSNKFTHNNTQVINVQMAVKNWEQRTNTEHLKESGVYKFWWLYTDDSTVHLPTAPYMRCDWNDSTVSPDGTVEIPLEDEIDTDEWPGYRAYVASHQYTEQGEYSITCTMFNEISEQSFDVVVTIYDTIIDFEVIPMYVPLGKDEAVDDPLPGMGPEFNQLPLNRNVTFFFNYTQGTFDTLEITRHTPNGVSNIVFDVPDKFDTKAFRVTLNYPEEGFYHANWSSKNPFMTEEYTATFEMVDLVLSLMLDDLSEVTSKEEEKWFYADFLSLGAHACLVVDFDDGVVEAYGDQDYCVDFAPDVTYIPEADMTPPVEISHIYYQYAVYNVTAYASNVVTEGTTKDFLLAIVTNAPCSPPAVSLPINSTSNVAPIPYMRSEQIVVESFAELDCAPVYTTTKNWKIDWASVDFVTMEEILTSVNILDVAPDTYQQPTLLIPPNTLEYGVHKLTLFVRMWDENDEDPNWTRVLPFERGAFSYIEIIASPLVPALFDGQMASVTRGSGQILTLAPRFFTYDPDYPDEPNDLAYRWYCRKAEETFAVDENDVRVYENLIPVPFEPLSTDEGQGGCFGTGPGPLGTTTDFLEMPREFFLPDNNVVYVIVMEVRKLDPYSGLMRYAETSLEVEIVPGIPPLMSVVCINPHLCFSHPSGAVYINPTNRLSLIGECSVFDGSDCTEPMTYEWQVSGADDTDLTAAAAAFFLSGGDQKELAVVVDFFGSGGPLGNREEFQVSLRATNALGSSGKSTMALKINKPPDSGSCVVSPDFGYAMDSFELDCYGWKDPEEAGIHGYQVDVLNVVTGIKLPIAALLTFIPSSPLIFKLSPGVYNVMVRVTDSWGAETTFVLPNEIVVNTPSEDDVLNFLADDPIALANGAGDTKELLNILQLTGNIISSSDGELMPPSEEEMSLVPENLQETLTPQQQQDKIDQQKDALKIDAVDTLLEMTGGAAPDIQTAEVLASTLNAIYGPEPDTSSSVLLGSKVTDAAAGLVESVKSFDAPSQEVLTTITTQLAQLLGNVLEQTAKTADLSSDYGSTGEASDGEEYDDYTDYNFIDYGDGGDSGDADGNDGDVKQEKDLCANVNAVDLANAKKPGMIEYDTHVTSIDMKIPEDSGQQACVGVIDSAKATLGDSGGKIMDMMKDLTMEVLSNSVVGEETIIEQGPITVYAKMTPGPELKKWHTIGNDNEQDAQWRMADNFCLGDLINGTCQTPAGIAAISYNTNPMCNVPTCDRLAKDTKILDLYLTNRKNKLLDLSRIYDDNDNQGALHLTIPRTNESRRAVEAPILFDPVTDANKKSIKYLSHQIPVRKADSILVIELFPEELDVDKFVLLLSFDRIPTLKKYEFGVMAEHLEWQGDDEYWEWVVPQEQVKNRTGDNAHWYLTVMSLTEDMSTEDFARQKPISKSMTTDFKSNYRLRTWTSGCYFFNEKDKAWVANGLLVQEANYGVTYCRSSHLTAFGGGFFVVPNPIDFEYIFAAASFTDNLTIYMCIIITLTLYLLLLIWAGYHDHQDEKRLISRPLVDNRDDDYYMYEILTFTGHHQGASCDSRVQVVVTGEEDETECRTLDPGPKVPGFEDCLRKGCVDSYIMKVPRPLGPLSYVRVWHDNTGRGDYASWHCQAIIVRDVQTNEKFEFVLNRWLATEKDDGQIDRLIPLSGDAQRNEFNHLFGHNREKSLKESHLWFSIFMRSERSRFTRMERVSTCMALLYLAMLADAMWYQAADETVNDGIKIGKITLSVQEIGIGIMSNLITFPPAFLIIFFFRKARKMKLRKNRINQAFERESALRAQRQEMEEQGQMKRLGKDNGLDKDGGQEDTLKELENRRTSIYSSADDQRPKSKFSTDSEVVEKISTAKSGRHRYRYQPRRKLVLPWFFSIIGWILCILCILASIFFLWAYAIQFGNDKTYKWLSSLLVSFFTGMLFLEPLKVLLIAAVLSCLCRHIDLDDDDVDEDEEKADLADESEWYHPSRRTGKTGVPIDEEFLELIRIARQKEVEMWTIVRELTGYVFFIMIVYIISYGNRDPISYIFKQTIENNFITRHKFEEVVTANDWWRWAHETLIPELRAQVYYNGDPPFGLRGFVGDHNNRIMGYGILRQIRVIPNSCRVDSRVHSITQECAKASAFINEDHSDYCNAWEEQNALTENLNSCYKSEFKYTKAEELDSLPYTAKLDVYGGGGYVYRLNSPQAQIKKDLLELQQQHWINNHTRAVFLEFSVYNAQINLFGICTIIAEFIPGGGIKPYWRIEPVRLLHHHQASGTFILACEVIFCCYIIYFIIYEIMEMTRLRCKYFNSYWVLADLGLIVLALIAIALYSYRLILTNDILNTFKETNGNGYIKLQYVGVIDETYGYTIGGILFVGTIKFIKLLRFNNRFMILILTLKVCWEDLSGFVSVFFLVFFAFVQVFYMILHVYMLEFHTVVAALETCFTMLLNKFKFGGIRDNSLTAAVMFFCFAISCSFILINVLLTIIIEAFEKMKAELNEQGNQYDILDFVFRQAKAVIGLDSLPPTESALREDAVKRRQGLDRNAAVGEDDHDDERDPNVEELPQKVDIFLNYVNTTYFDGTLDLGSKEMIKKGIGPEPADVSGPPLRRVFNGSDDIGTCPPATMDRRRRVFNS